MRWIILIGVAIVLVPVLWYGLSQIQMFGYLKAKERWVKRQKQEEETNGKTRESK
jgi:hypothetical protein